MMRYRRGNALLSILILISVIMVASLLLTDIDSDLSDRWKIRKALTCLDLSVTFDKPIGKVVVSGDNYIIYERVSHDVSSWRYMSKVDYIDLSEICDATTIILMMDTDRNLTVIKGGVNIV